MTTSKRVIRKRRRAHPKLQIKDIKGVETFSAKKEGDANSQVQSRHEGWDRGIVLQPTRLGTSPLWFQNMLYITLEAHP